LDGKNGRKRSDSPGAVEGLADRPPLGTRSRIAVVGNDVGRTALGIGRFVVGTGKSDSLGAA